MTTFGTQCIQWTRAMFWSKSINMLSAIAELLKLLCNMYQTNTTVKHGARQSNITPYYFGHYILVPKLWKKIWNSQLQEYKCLFFFLIWRLSHLQRKIGASMSNSNVCDWRMFVRASVGRRIFHNPAYTISFLSIPTEVKIKVLCDWSVKHYFCLKLAFSWSNWCPIRKVPIPVAAIGMSGWTDHKPIGNRLYVNTIGGAWHLSTELVHTWLQSQELMTKCSLSSLILGLSFFLLFLSAFPAMGQKRLEINIYVA